jgi:hypothetical protein
MTNGPFYITTGCLAISICWWARRLVIGSHGDSTFSWCSMTIRGGWNISKWPTRLFCNWLKVESFDWEKKHKGYRCDTPIWYQGGILVLQVISWPWLLVIKWGVCNWEIINQHGISGIHLCYEFSFQKSNALAIGGRSK